MLAQRRKPWESYEKNGSPAPGRHKVRDKRFFKTISQHMTFSSITPSPYPHPAKSIWFYAIKRAQPSALEFTNL
jgi:hypothetical protein